MRYGGLVQALIAQGVLTEEDVTRSLAAHNSMEFVDISQMVISPDVIAAVPAETARRYRVIPISMSDSSLMIAVDNPLGFETFDAVSHILGRDVEYVCSTPEQVKTALMKYYGTADEAASELESHL